MRLFFIGLCMGIADLIPGISGGTIAFICGIYEELLKSIKSLQFHSLRNIAWPFLLPVGGGIATALLLLPKLLYFLLQTFPAPLFGFFFGLILTSALHCGRRAELKKVSHFFTLLIGVGISFFLSSLSANLLVEPSFLRILFCALLASFAMLLPGISGSFFLQVIGIYPIVLYALNSPSSDGAPKILIAMAIGVALGCMIFSRVVSFLLTYFHQSTISLLVGFMLGGLKVLWPFNQGHFFLSFLFIILGSLLVILLEMKTKRSISSH